jgi:hypothetical protein
MGDDSPLVLARISFHTNDEDKDADTRVEISVETLFKSAVASLSADLGHFDNHTDAGPFDLQLIAFPTRGELKNGHVSLKIAPNGHDTWRFNFVLDLLFADGAHLLALATGLELSETRSHLVFGII